MPQWVVLVPWGSRPQLVTALVLVSVGEATRPGDWKKTGIGCLRPFFFGQPETPAH